MYTKTNNKKLTTMITFIIFLLMIAMVVNIQNAYAESDILGMYTYFEESIEMVNSLEEENYLIMEEAPKPALEDMNIYISTTSFSDVLEAERQKKIEEKERIAQLEAMTVSSTRNVQYNEINVYTDLSVMKTITADQMNEIIDYWGSIRNGNMPFTGKGQIFIDAAKESGLDPVYILAHAAFESGWGTSYYATAHHNYFGIGAFDSNPSNAVNYGNDGMANGIINGAKWIADNYYSAGQTTLHTMRYSPSGTHNYCSSTTWGGNIAHIMSVSYELIQ